MKYFQNKNKKYKKKNNNKSAILCSSHEPTFSADSPTFYKLSFAVWSNLIFVVTCIKHCIEAVHGDIRKKNDCRTLPQTIVFTWCGMGTELRTMHKTTVSAHTNDKLRLRDTTFVLLAITVTLKFLRWFGGQGMAWSVIGFIVLIVQNSALYELMIISKKETTKTNKQTTWRRVGNQYCDQF